MKTKNISVVWFEIPVANMERAMAFYEKVFDVKLSRNQMGSLDMAWFSSSPDMMGAAGSLVYQSDFYTPSQQGVLVYLNSISGDLDKDLEKIEGAGGKVLVPRKLISEEVGYMCVFEDSEGNRIAIHTKPAS